MINITAFPGAFLSIFDVSNIIESLQANKSQGGWQWYFDSTCTLTFNGEKIKTMQQNLNKWIFLSLFISLSIFT